MKKLVFQWFRCFVGSPPLGASSWPLAGLLASLLLLLGPLLASCSCWPLPGLFLASCWLLAGLLLASSWHLPGFLLASPLEYPARAPRQSIPPEHLARTSRQSIRQSLSPEHPARASATPPELASCWPLAGFLLAVEVLAGLLLASCWHLAGLLASCWPPCLLLACCWPVAGFLASCWLQASPRGFLYKNNFVKGLAKPVNSFHENTCFSMVSVFRGVPPIWGFFLASWPLAGLLLASCLRQPLAGLLASCCSCWLLAAFLLASCWSLPGLLLASCWPLGFLLASSWSLPGLLLACPPSRAPRQSIPPDARAPPEHPASLLLASLLASCWPERPEHPARASCQSQPVL